MQDVTRKALADLIFSADEIDAQTALAIGMISRVIPAADLDGALGRLCEQLAAHDRLAVQVMKGFLGKPGRLDPEHLSDLADFTLATAATRPR